jgi:predicted RNA polymerase sigma factor
VHDEALRPEETDWLQILGLYDVLQALAPGPMVTLNRIVAVAMVHGAGVALGELAAVVERDETLRQHYRVHAVRAHLLELAGETSAARSEYEVAARSTLSLPEQRYLMLRAGRLGASAPSP